MTGAKFTLRPKLAFSYIGSATARHSSSGRQPIFAAFSRRRHLYSARRPSRWASADILVNFLKLLTVFCPDCLRFRQTVTDSVYTARRDDHAGHDGLAIYRCSLLYGDDECVIVDGV